MICGVRIEKFDEEEYDYIKDGTGPYCEKCWVFRERYEELRERIEKLEKQTAEVTRPNARKNHNRPSPYDLSARSPGFGRQRRGRLPPRHPA